MHIIAIDAGGTRTRFGLYDLEGQCLYQLEHPSYHPLVVGYQKMANGLKLGVEACLQESHDPSFMISFGLAGYGQNPKIRASIERAIRKAFKDVSYLLHNDVECAMMAALQGKDGIMLVAGTGSIALRTHLGIRARSGGWGYHIGDEGSAYWMGKKVLGLFSKQADGRLEKTALYDCVMDSLVLEDPSSLIHILASHPHPKDAIAALARVAFLAHEKQDRHAIALFNEAALELALLVKSLQYPSPSVIPVKCTGGVFESKEALLKPLREALGDQYLVELSEYPPLYGAYLYARQNIGEQT